MRLRSGSRPAALFSSLLGLLLAVAVVPMLASPAHAALIGVQGTVTGLDASGSTVPIKDAFVEVNAANGNPLSPRVYAYTGSDGKYRLDVPAAGTYQVAIKCWGTYACAQDYAPDPAVTRSITTAATINATLDRWGRITGTVKKNGVTTAWPNGLISASNDARQYWSTDAEVRIAGNGTFAIEKVAPGAVKVTGDEAWNAEPFLTAVADQSVTVPAGGTGSIALAVEDWRGAYARAVAPDGTPLPGIRFNIFSRPIGGAWDQGIQAGPLLTDAAGRMKWRLPQADREYTLCFYDDHTDPEVTPPARRRLSRCLGNSPGIAGATVWRPTAAVPKLKQDIALPYAFTTVPTPTVSGTAKVGSTLTATAGAWVPAATTTTYEWFRSGVTAPVATGASYQLVAADLGRTMTVRATGVRAGYVTTSKTSAATSAVAAADGSTAAFSTVPVPTVTGTKVVGATLTAVPGTWVPAPTTTTYQWYRAGVAIPGAVARTYRLTASDAGRRISVRVTGARSGYATRAVSSVATGAILRTFAKAPAPRITGTRKVRSTLTASLGTWSPTPTTTTYRWYRNGVAIKGATTRSYKLTAADRRKRIKVVVKRSRAGHVTTTRTSASTPAIS